MNKEQKEVACVFQSLRSEEFGVFYGRGMQWKGELKGVSVHILDSFSSDLAYPSETTAAVAGVFIKVEHGVNMSF